MRLVVFGANGRTGAQVVKQAIAQGHNVVAAVRRPDALDFTAPRLDVVRADARDIDSTMRAIAESDAVISVLGTTYTTKPITLFSEGIGNITKAMTTHGISRLACVSSVCVTGEPAPGETLLFRTVLLPLLLRAGRTAYHDLRRMEDIVRGSGLDWTIIRASGLFNSTRVTDYTVSPTSIPGRYTSRADLADALLRTITIQEYAGTTLDVITTEGTPSFRNKLRRNTSSRPATRG